MFSRLYKYKTKTHLKIAISNWDVVLPLDRQTCFLRQDCQEDHQRNRTFLRETQDTAIVKSTATSFTCLLFGVMSAEIRRNTHKKSSTFFSRSLWFYVYTLKCITTWHDEEDEKRSIRFSSIDPIFGDCLWYRSETAVFAFRVYFQSLRKDVANNDGSGKDERTRRRVYVLRKESSTCLSSLFKRHITVLRKPEMMQPTLGRLHVTQRQDAFGRKDFEKLSSSAFSFHSYCKAIFHVSSQVFASFVYTVFVIFYSNASSLLFRSLFRRWFYAKTFTFILPKNHPDPASDIILLNVRFFEPSRVSLSLHSVVLCTRRVSQLRNPYCI